MEGGGRCRGGGGRCRRARKEDMGNGGRARLIAGGETAPDYSRPVRQPGQEDACSVYSREQLPLSPRTSLQITLLDTSKGMERGVVLTGPNIFKYRHVRFSEDDKVWLAGGVILPDCERTAVCQQPLQLLATMRSDGMSPLPCFLPAPASPSSPLAVTRSRRIASSTCGTGRTPRHPCAAGRSGE